MFLWIFFFFALVVPSFTLQMSFVESVLPKAKPMPLPLVSDVPGTWAHDTMSRRVLAMVDDVIEDNPSWREPLMALRLEIERNEALKPICDGAVDEAEWNALLEREKGKTWLSATWLLAEFYLYRRIVECTCYFKNKVDVFEKAKRLGLEASMDTLEELAKKADFDLDPTETFLCLSLWGNRMDLSLWPASTNVAAQKGQFDEVLKQSKKQLLKDDAFEASKYLDSLKDATIDIVVDNAGFELVADLFLADFLIASGKAKQVRLRTKHHPTFVSDVLNKDVHEHVDILSKVKDFPNFAKVASRWKSYLDNEKLILKDETYWAMPYPLWEMPPALRRDLTSSALIVVKGDANYRRALGDRPWPYDAPFADVCSYFPAPVLCLRTLKAELGTGMDIDKVNAASKADPNWLTNGKWGVLQFREASSAPSDN